MRYLRPIAFGLVLAVMLAVPAGLISLRSYFLAPTNQPIVEQPIEFPHTIHATTLGLDCTFCHRMAEIDAAATLPAIEQCMFCHKIIPSQGRPQLERLVSAFQNNQSIQWSRVHQVPDHVHFVHAMHINAGFDCATCHGDVAKMGVAEQVRDLRMGDCIACHRQNNARTDCAVCHY